MKRRFRLTRSTDFKRVRRLGKSFAHPLVVLVLLANDEPELHIGVAAGRSVGGAVQRNRAKRLLRTAAHDLVPQVRLGWNVILLARQPIGGATYQQVQSAVRELASRACLLKDSYGG